VRKSYGCAQAAGLTFFLLLLATPMQPASRIEVDWQPISPADLALKDNPAAPGDDAMILYRESVIDDWDGSATEYVRIKVFTAQGRRWADIQIPFVPGAREIKELRARTIKPDGTIVEFNGQMFDEVVLKMHRFKAMVRKFSLPDVSPGTIIEYICRRQNSSLNVSLNWKNEFTVQSALYTRLGVFVCRPFPGPGLAWRQHGLPPGVTPEIQKDGSFQVEVHDFPGAKVEALIPPERLTKARLEFYRRFKPVAGSESASEYWNEIGKLWSKNVETFIGKKNSLEKVVAQTVAADDPPETKLRKLYDRAQQIRNLDYAADDTTRKSPVLKPNETAEDALKHGYGTSQEINYVFVALARAAGFEAWSVAITPRGDDLFLPNLQDSWQLTADVVYVQLASLNRYVDPGDAFFPYDLLPWDMSESGGLRLQPDGGTLVTTTAPVSAGATLLRHADLELNADGSVSGKLAIDWTGQSGCLLRAQERDKSNLARDKTLADEVKSWLPADATFEVTSTTGWSSNSVPLHAEGTLRIPEYATGAGNRLLAPVTIFRASQTKDFQSATRVNQIYFSYPYQERDEISLKLPAAYSIEAMPRGEKTPKSLVEFDLAVSKEGQALHTRRLLVVDAYSFPVTAYPSLRKFFETVGSADEQQIVMESAQASAQ
jgi:hypothetical protein